MKPLDVSLLDPFSEAFSDQLFALYPEWRSRAGMVEGSAAFELLIPSPADPDRFLWISTDDEEPSVGFDRWHGHFGRGQKDLGEATREALALIAALPAEHSAVQSYFRGEQWIGSVLVASSTGWVDGVFDWRASAATRMSRRSWNGTLNADLPLPAGEGRT